MADNNRNRSNPYQEDWDQNRNRFNAGDENQQRHVGNYGNEYQQGNRGQQQGHFGYSGGSQQAGYDAGRSHGGAYSSDYGSPYGSGYEQSNYDSRRTGSNQFGNSGWGRQQDEENWNRNAGYGAQRNEWEQQQRSGWGSNYNPDIQQRNTGNYGSNQGFSSGQSYGQSGQYRQDNYGQGNYGNAGHMDNRHHGRGQEGYSGDRDRNWWDRTKDEVSSWFGSDNNERRNERQSGPYRGKGPKDYQRSEDRIREDVCDRLSDDDHLDATHIQVQIQNNEVILTGTVENREQKRRAEDLVESISGVRNVENRLRVGSKDDFSARDYTGSTDRTGGIGTESGTTNEIIRNERTKR